MLVTAWIINGIILVGAIVVAGVIVTLVSTARDLEASEEYKCKAKDDK